MDVELEPGPTQSIEGATGLGETVAPTVRLEDRFVEALHPELDLRRPQSTESHDLGLVDVVGARLEDEPDAAGAGGLVGPLRRFEGRPVGPFVFEEELAVLAFLEKGGHPGVVRIAIEGVAADVGVDLLEVRGARVERLAFVPALPEVGHRFEAALHEPDLVGLGIEGPGPAEDDQLDLVDGMPGRVEGCQPVPGLQVGIEAIVRGPLGAGLVGQVALGHPHVVGTEDALARTGKGLRQDRERRDPAPRADRAPLYAPAEPGLVEAETNLRREGAEARDQLTAREEAATRSGMSPEQRLDHFRLERLDHVVRDRLDLPEEREQRLARRRRIEIAIRRTTTEAAGHARSALLGSLLLFGRCLRHASVSSPGRPTRPGTSTAECSRTQATPV